MRNLFLIILVFMLLNVQVLNTGTLRISSSVVCSAEAEEVSEFVVKDETNNHTEAWISLIVMLGINYVVGTAVINSYPSPAKAPVDVKIAAASAISYMYAEYLSWKTYRDLKNSTVSYSSDAGLGEKQVEQLEKQRKQYLELSSLARKKAIIQGASAAGFLAAMGYALREETRLQKLMLKREQLKNDIELTIQSISKTGVNPAMNLALENLRITIENSEKIFKGLEKLVNKKTFSLKIFKKFKREKVERIPSDLNRVEILLEKVAILDKQNGMRAKRLVETVKTWRQTALNQVEMMFQGIGALKKKTNPISDFDNLAATNASTNNGLLAFLIPSAHASTLTNLGLSASAFGILTSVVYKVLRKTDFYFSSYKKRAVIWGVFGGLAGMASFMSNGISKKMEENADKVRDTIRNFSGNFTTQALIGMDMNVELEILEKDFLTRLFAVLFPVGIASVEVPLLLTCVDNGKGKCIPIKKNFKIMEKAVSVLARKFGRLPANALRSPAYQRKSIKILKYVNRKAIKAIGKFERHRGNRPTNFERLQRIFLNEIRKSAKVEIKRSGKTLEEVLDRFNMGTVVSIGGKHENIREFLFTGFKSKKKDDDSNSIKDQSLKLSDVEKSNFDVVQKHDGPLDDKTEYSELIMSASISKDKDRSIFSQISRRYSKLIPELVEKTK